MHKTKCIYNVSMKRESGNYYTALKMMYHMYVYALQQKHR